MLVLAGASALVSVTTGAAVTSIQIHASWVDNSSGFPASSANTTMSTATTTTIVSGPGTGNRTVQNISIENTDTALSCSVTVNHNDGSVTVPIMSVTLLPGENLIMSEDGTWAHHDYNGAEYTASMLNDYTYALGLTGTIAESIPRMVVDEANMSAIVSGTLFMTAVFLRAGQVITGIGFMSATTALSAGTHQIFGLYDANRNLLAQTNDDTSTAWGANTLKKLALTSQYKVPNTGLYYVGILVTATTAVPTIKGKTLTNTQLHGLAPITHGSSTASLTALPSPAAALTVGTSLPWCMLY